MPILVTTEFPPPGYGGIERYMFRLATEIFAAGHPLAVVAPHMPGCDNFDAQLPYRVFRFPFPGHDSPEHALLWAYRVRAATSRACRAMNTDATIASSWLRAGLACATMRKTERGKLAIVAHGSEILSQSSRSRKLVMRSVFSRADVAVANSSFTASLLREAGITTKTVLGRCGIEAQPSTRSRSIPRTILSVGRLVKRKGFDHTIRAVALLKPEFPDLQHQIVGTGPDERYLRDLAREVGVEQCVHFMGSVPDDALRDCYARASCFALPTRRVGAGDVEGFGIVYLEAAMQGVAAVGGINSGAIDAIEDGRSGLLVDGEDPQAIAGALRRLLHDPELADRMGAYGRQRALREFTWKKAAHDIMAALQQPA